MHEPTDPNRLEEALEADLSRHGISPRRWPGAPGDRGDLASDLAATARRILDTNTETVPEHPDPIATVLDLIGQAQRASDPQEMVRLMREATATMDAHRAATPLYVPDDETEPPQCAGTGIHVHSWRPMIRQTDGWYCAACPQFIRIEPAEDRPEPDEAPLPSWDRLREIAEWADLATVGIAVPRDLRAIADDYEAMAGRELARQKATTGPAWAPTTPDLTARLAKARRLADERGRYIEALETVLCPDGVPQAVTRAMDDLRPVPEVMAPPKIVDLEQVLDELARHEASAVQWDGSVTEAARRLRAAVALARVRASEGMT